MASGLQGRSSLGVAVAIVVGFLFTPQIASAECGDHVRIVDQVTDGAGALRPAETKKHLPLAPCSGPNCSADPLSPVVPIESTVNNSPVVKISAVRDEEVRDRRIESSWGASIANDERPVRRVDTIFHPPRS